MSLARVARVAIQPLKPLFAASRRWLLPAAILLAVVCFGLLRSSNAVVQNQPPLGIVSAASNEADALAPESLATAYGLRLATQSDIAVTPQPQLAGTTVDVGGRAALLLYVSPEQVNFLVPAGVPAGPATVTVRAGDGVISTGTTNINAVAPALFTAGSVVSGFALRVKADGALSYEPVAEFDASNSQYNPKAIDLNSSAGDQVFLVFYLSGLRGADPAQVRVVLGGDEFTPIFAGAVPGIPGLDQINLTLPGNLAGKGVLNLVVKAPNARPSNPAKVEIGGGVSTLAVTQLSKQTVVASETLEIEGTNLPTSNVEVLFAPNVGVVPDTATPTKMTLRVPFGVEAGTVRINVNKQVAWVRPDSLDVVTSVSGFVQEFRDNARVGVPGLPVVMVESSGRRLETVTSSAGAFLFKDAAASFRSTIQIGGQAANALNYQSPPFGMRVRDKRDNQLSKEEVPIIVEVKPDGPNDPSLIVANRPVNETLRVATLAGPGETAGVITSGQVVFDTNNSTVTCPGGGSGCQLALAVFDAGRTPANLPAGYFSSAIAQITPFGATLAPGGKLTFPNSDGISAGTPVRVFRFDQTPDSATFGQFLDIGAGAVSGDGQRLETGINAVTQTSYYFVSRLWQTATIIGHVVEADGQRPVRRAVVNARGQSTFTDGNGGFVLRNVPVIKAGDTLTLEVSFHRADGSISRTERAGVAISAGAQVTLATDISLSQSPGNAGPAILAPATLSLNEGETREFNFIVTGLAANALPELAGPSFATRRGLGNEAFALRLAPPAGSAGSYQITLTATAQNKTTRQVIAVTVTPASMSTPLARSDAVVTAEDTPVNITLTSANAGGAPIYNIVAQPLHGTVNRSGAVATYTPAANYNGTDSFSFKVGDGNDPRSIAIVSIAVRPMNDAPVITKNFDPQIIDAGQTIKLIITAFDPDGDQTLTCDAAGAPGVSRQNLRQLTPSSWEFANWTPTFLQNGTYSIRFTVSDGSLNSPDKILPVTVITKAAQTSGPEGGLIKSLLNATTGLYAGAEGGGIFRSTDDGTSWLPVNRGLAGDALDILSLTEFAGALYAGTGDTIYRSTDNGQNWTALSEGLGENTAYTFLAVNGVLYAGGTSSGVYRLNANGQSWSPVGTGFPFGAGALASFGGNLYAAGFGIYRLASGQQNWMPINGGLPTDSSSNVVDVDSLAVFNSGLYAGTRAGVYRLNDNGAGWSKAGNNFPTGVLIKALVVKSNVLYAATRNVPNAQTLAGVYRLADNGQSWSSANGNITDRGFQVEAMIAVRNSLFIGTDGRGILRSFSNEQSWGPLNTGITAAATSQLLNHESGLLAATFGGLYRSTNRGQTYSPVTIFSSLRANSLLSVGAVLYTGTNDGVYQSSDGGTSWTRTSDGLSLSNNGLTVLALFADGSAVYAGTGNGVYRLNGGVWTSVSDGLSGASLQIYSLITFGGRLYTGTSGGVYRLEGSSWIAVNTNLSGAGLLVNKLVETGGVLYACTNGAGIYRLSDNPQQWTAVGSGLSGNALRVNVLVPFSNALYIGTDNGAFRLNGSAWTTVGTLSGNAVFVYDLLSAGGSLYAGTFGGGVYRLEGSNWTAINNGLFFLGAYVRDLLANGNVLFAATYQGVYRSTDNGQTWTAVGSGMPGRPLYARNLAATSGGLFVGFDGHGVYRSTDNGQSWTAVNNGLPASNLTIYTLASVSTTLYVATVDGLYRSTNNGALWSKFNTGLTTQVTGFATLNNTLYAATADGVFHLDGSQWTEFNPDLPQTPQTRYIYSILAHGDTLLIANQRGVYRLEGGRWTPSNNGLTGTLYIQALAARGNNVYAGDNSGFFRSTDGGRNWRSFALGLEAQNIGSIVAEDDIVYVGTEGAGIFRISNNAQSWTEKNNGLDSRSVNAVAVKGSRYFIGTLGKGVFRSDNQGTSWTPANAQLPPSPNVQTIVTAGASLFIGTLDQGVYRSNDDGDIWTPASTGLPVSNGKPVSVNLLRVSGAALFAATDAGVFRIDNFRTSTQWMPTTITAQTRGLLALGATVYAGAGNGLHRSVDGGRQWENLGFVDQVFDPGVLDALAASADGTVLFAGNSGFIFRSTDQGRTWTPLFKNLPLPFAAKALVASGSYLYAGGLYGAFVSTNNGTDWEQINAGLLNINLTAFGLNGDKLLAGTKSGGFFSSQIPNQPPCIGITAQPASKTISSNQTATLTVTPSGDQPFQFQWYQGASGDFSRPIAGATANTLTTAALTQTAGYWVSVSNNCGTANSETATVIVSKPPQIDLALTQTAAPAQARPGDDVSFALTVANNGQDAAFAVTVTDALPSQVTFKSCEAMGGVCGGAGNNRTVTFASLAAGASATITLRAKVNDNASGVVRNTASASAGVGETDLLNNVATASVIIAPADPNALFIAALNPNTATAGGAGFTLMLTGGNFAGGAQVRWNGAMRPTSFVSATQLTAQIPATDLATAGVANVTVASPAGVLSNSLPFAIRQACSYALTASSQHFGGGGGTGTVIVTTGPGCAWTASSASFRLQVTGGASGTGNGTVNFSLRSNSGQTTRFLSLLIAGQHLLIMQAGGPTPCSLTNLSVGQTINGTLAAGDCRSQLVGGANADFYTFNGQAGQRVAITLSASSFDPYLTLNEPNGQVITSNNDNVGLNSRIPIGNDYLVLPFTGTYLVEARSFSSDVTGNYTLSISNAPGAPGNCTYTVMPSQQVFPAAGSASAIAVNAPAGCGWTALASNSSQVTITAGNSGTGSGEVRFTVASNTQATPALDYLLVAGQYVTLVTSGNTGNCGVTPLSEGRIITGELTASDCRSLDFPSAAGDLYAFSGQAGQRIALVMSAANYDVSLLLFGPGGRLVAFNDLTGRTGSIPAGNGYLTLPYTGVYLINASAISGQATGSYTLNLTTTLDGLACGFSLTPTSRAFTAAGDTGTVSVTAPGGCNWTAESPVSWLTISGGNTGSGNGAVNFSVAPNSGPARSGALLIAGQTFTVTQAAASLSLAIASLSPNTAQAGSAGFALTIAGTNFVANSKVRWNGGERATTFGSATQLTAQIPASDLTVAGTATVTVANPDGSISAGATFTITQPPPVNRVLRVAPSSGSVGGAVSVPIELVAQGDENAFGFSLTFDPAILSNPQVALGIDAAGATLNQSAGQAAQGRLGVLLALPAGQRFAAGVRQVAVVTFTIAAGTSAATSNIGFGDQPVVREVSDINGEVLQASYLGGAVTITRGFEGDVAPRPNGNGSLTVTDWVLVGRFASGDLTVEPGSEFQRTDCAPRSSFGNGSITVTDWVQAGRYAAGLDPLTPAAGPLAANASAAAEVSALLKKADGAWPRLLRVSSPTFGAGQSSAVRVELLAQGEENAVSFSLRFDSRQWRFVSATVGEDAPNAALNINTKLAADGRVGFALALPPGRTLAAGMRSLVMVNFVAAEDGGTLAPEVAFSDLPAPRELADVKATVLSADWMPVAARELANVSSAGLTAGTLAPGSLVTAFGDGLATATQIAEAGSLPMTLAGTSVRILDSAGVEHTAPLFFVAPGQVNYLLPSETALGRAVVRVVNGEGVVVSSVIEVADVAPSLFTANASGQGVAAGVVIRVSADGRQQFEPLAVYDAAQNRFVAAPVDLSDETEQVFLALFGTGWRNGGGLGAGQVTIDGVLVERLYAGAQGGQAGLDQLNLRLPHALRGRGEVTLQFNSGGRAANPVKLVIK